METSRTVIKRDRVRLSGRRAIGPAGARASAGEGGSPAGEPKARIVEQDQDAALIEVTCPCGRKTYLRCTYPAPAEAAPTLPRSETPTQ
ncbi:MAG: hypothetical protein ACOC8F_00795 [Planctomycetota bacterium]